MSTSARRFTALVAVAMALGGIVPAGAAMGDLPGLVKVGDRPQRDVVVWLEGVRSTSSSPGTAVLDQRNLTFIPHVLAVRVGAVVSMPNNDRVFHNVFSFKDGKKFDLGLYPVGKSKLVTFDRAGVSRIFCNIHPNMAAYVVVVDSDVFAVSDASGAFTLAGVPAGTYTYHAWRAGHDPATGRVTVEPGGRLEIDFR